jgi:hypothetical protein
MKKLISLLAALVVGYLAATVGNGIGRGGASPAPSSAPRDSTTRSTAAVGRDAGSLEEVFDRRQGNVQVQAAGEVVRTLADDNDGSRHQRIIVRMPSGQTVLIAHNIDLAPRVEGLRPGDRVAFFGEYEWNPEGGVVHWTHRDPAGQHVAGWLEVAGKRYR